MQYSFHLYHILTQSQLLQPPVIHNIFNSITSSIHTPNTHQFGSTNTQNILIINVSSMQFNSTHIFTRSFSSNTINFNSTRTTCNSAGIQIHLSYTLIHLSPTHSYYNCCNLSLPSPLVSTITQIQNLHFHELKS